MKTEFDYKFSSFYDVFRHILCTYPWKIYFADGKNVKPDTRFLFRPWLNFAFV